MKGWVGDITRDAILGACGVNDSGKAKLQEADGATKSPETETFSHESFSESARTRRIKTDDSERGITRPLKGGDPPSPFPFHSIYREMETETESSEIHLEPLREFLSAPPEPVNWIAESLIPQQTITIISGDPNVGKSWIALDFALDCVLGREWLGRFKTNAKKVVYLDLESSREFLFKRLNALLLAKGACCNTADFLLGIHTPIEFSDLVSVDRLRRALEPHNPDLVIVDPLAFTFTSNENDSGDMSRLFKTIKALSFKLGCAFILIDHQRKPSQFETRPGMLLRGSTAKFAAVDQLLTLQSDSSGLTLTHAKARYSEKIPTIRIEMGVQADGSFLISCTGEKSGSQSPAKRAMVRDTVCDVLKSHADWLRRKDLIDRLANSGISEKKLTKTLRALVKDKSIEKDSIKLNSGRGGKSDIYRWPELRVTP